MFSQSTHHLQFGMPPFGTAGKLAEPDFKVLLEGQDGRFTLRGMTFWRAGAIAKQNLFSWTPSAGIP